MDVPALCAVTAGDLEHPANSVNYGCRVMTRTAEQTTMRKVYLRLLPFSILCMFVCYLDRVNVGFAALTMNKDLGFGAYLFGLGAGAFYGGYCLFEVPSNLMLEKVGARFWLARIMITWGLFSGAMAFVSGLSALSPCAFCSAPQRPASFPASSSISIIGFRRATAGG